MTEYRMKRTWNAGQVERIGEAVFPRDVTYTVTGDPAEPDITVRFEIRDGRPELVEFSMLAKPKGRGLRASDLQIFIDSLVERAFAKVALIPRDGGGMTPPKNDSEIWRARGAATEARQTTRRKTPQATLEEVARVYQQHITGAPTAAVAAFFSLSHRTAARRVKEAADAGLLPKGDQGKKRG